MKDFKLLIKNRKFVHLWMSQIFSQLTINVMNFVLLLRIVSQTSSSIAASLLWVFYALPSIIIGPAAAVFVDTFDRRKILMFTNILQAITIFLYALSRDEQFFLLFFVVFIYSFLNQFYVPAEQASLPTVVGNEDNFPVANSLFFITQQGALIVGFGIAGAILHLLGFTNTLYVCALMLFLAFLSVSFLPKIKGAALPKNWEEGFLDFFKRISEGYSFIKEHNRILFPFVLLIAAQIGMVVAVVNAPIFATEILNIRIVNSGVGIVVPVGLGAAAGAYFVSSLIKKDVRKKKIIQNLALVLAASIFVLANVVDYFPGEFKYLAGMVALVASGFSFVGILISAQTFLQEVTPGGMRGRVFGNFWFLTTIATIIPVLFSATLTEILGIRTLMFVLVVGLLITYFLSVKYGEKLLRKK